MRTAILMGLFYIGDAIGKPTYGEGSSVNEVIAIIWIACIIMDIVDFVRNNQ